MNIARICIAWMAACLPLQAAAQDFPAKPMRMVIPFTAGGATDVMGRRTRAPIHAFLGPSIGPECYEFGEVDGRRLAQRFGPSIMGTTAAGAFALDVRSAARSELVGRGVLIEIDDARCTACTDDFFSHRARNEDGRQTTVAWIEGP